MHKKINAVIVSIIITVCIACCIISVIFLSDLSAENKQLVEDICYLQTKLDEKEIELQLLNAGLSEIAAGKEYASGVLYILPEYSKAFVENDTDLRILPGENAAVISTIPGNMVLTVIDEAGFKGETWFYVAVPVFKTPMDCKGWIKKDETVIYTIELKEKVKGPVTIKKGTRCYYVSAFSDIAAAAPDTLEHDFHGIITQKNGGYSLISSTGGIEFWVRDEDVFVPES
jgi:hypothetical protein